MRFNGGIDYNGVQDVDDYEIIDFVINIQGPPCPTGMGVGMTVSTVPEPSVMGVLAAGALLRRQRRERRKDVKS